MRLLQRPAWAAAAVLLAGLIGSPRLFAISDRWDVLSLGRGNGEDSFAVAMISDLHADIPDLRGIGVRSLLLTFGHGLVRALGSGLAF